MRQPTKKIAKLSDEEARIREETDRAIAAIRARATQKVRDLRAEKRMAQKVAERAAAKTVAKMAFVLGAFVMRNGVDDPTVKAIVQTDAFDEFTKSKRMRGQRALFGLEPIAPAPEGG